MHLEKKNFTFQSPPKGSLYSLHLLKATMEGIISSLQMLEFCFQGPLHTTMYKNALIVHYFHSNVIIVKNE